MILLVVALLWLVIAVATAAELPGLRRAALVAVAIVASLAAGGGVM